MSYHPFDFDEKYNRIQPHTKVYCDPPPEGLGNVVFTAVQKFIESELRYSGWQGDVTHWAYALHIWQECKQEDPNSKLVPLSHDIWNGFQCFKAIESSNRWNSTVTIQALNTLYLRLQKSITCTTSQNVTQILLPNAAALVNTSLQRFNVKVQPTPQASEPTEQKKNMANEKLVECKSKTKTPKEQVSLIGGAMSEGVTMGFTNKTGDILLDLAASVLPNNEAVQAALKDPAGQAVIKVVMAVLLHTACESGAPIPASEHVARAARAQITFSTAVLTGFLLTDAAVQLTALAEIGRKFAEVENKSE